MLAADPEGLTVPDTNAPTRWQPDRVPNRPPWPVPPMATALWRGARGLCPACGQTHAFVGYLTVVKFCVACGAPLGELRADDAPPYFTIFIVGHVVIGLMFAVEHAYAPPFWLQAAIWLPVTLVLALVLLRPIKGATLGLMLNLGMTKSADE
jgi:uncharacterized protein (DUF983 family)